MHTCLVFLVGREMGTEMLHRESLNNKDDNYKKQRVGFRHINYINKQFKRKFHMALSAKLNSVLCLRRIEHSDVTGMCRYHSQMERRKIGRRPQQQK